MTIYETLSHYWGHSQFRPLQEDIINSVVDGNDTLALMPTGGGKSICFQVPAMIKPGICIVVSPLIALMKDQVENLLSKGIKAVSIVSGMGKREIDILLDNCIYGQIKFLYLSPERLLSELVRERIRHMKVNLIAIDEAHCISQWGYDFRPPYLQLSKLRELHPTVPVLALTATATERVVDDIQEKLGFKKSNVLRKSFERKNLSYVVATDENKLRKLFTIAKKVSGSGIVYVRNRRETQEVARLLNQNGIASDFYHAGLETPVKSARQEAWKNNRINIIVATNAFGMGIDKPDVRFVVHLDLPESLEAYYQEAGRAGRDGQKSFAVLLYNISDRLQLEKRFLLNFPPVEEIKKTYHLLCNYFQIAYGAGEGISLEFDIADFCSRFKLDGIKTVNALKFLERDGYIALSENVFLQSRVRIIASAEDVYSFQIENAIYDGFIKILLRSYGGLFDQFTTINETDLSRRVSQSREQVVVILRKLEELGLLSYMPQTDKPQLLFVKPRAEPQNLAIDAQYLAQRKQIMQKQIASVIEYAEAKTCRSFLLLTYLDETNAHKCGICDVCLEEKRSLNEKFLSDFIAEEIFQLLPGKHMHLDELVSSLKPGTEKQRIDVIRNLLDAGKIKYDGEKYYA